jgi:hypothetical protein
MKDLLISKNPERDCFIVNKFFRRFKVNSCVIVLSNREAYDKDCLVYQSFLY